MKIAILHEMLIKLGGAEKVVENWMVLFPGAPVFTLIYDEKKVGKIFPKNKIHPQVFKIKSQKVYNLTKRQRFCLPFMAKSVESLDFSEFDVVLCSSSGFAHGAITKPETKFIVYYHSPARYMWDWTNEYKKDLGLNFGWKKIFLRPIINSLFLKLRQWDYIASKRVDISLANSSNTANRIGKYYKKEAEVLYPPVEVERFKVMVKSSLVCHSEFSSESSKNSNSGKDNLNCGDIVKDPEINSGGQGNYYIIISALTEFKKIEVAINGFNEILSSNLLIIGAGDYRETLEKMVKGKNIIFVGPKYGDELVNIVQNSLGLVFPGEEDFGIVPIEVMAAGKPVFAYKGGGLLETNIEGITGEFFEDKNGKDFVRRFKKFNENNKKGKYKKENCIKQAKKFDKKKFEEKIFELVKF